MSRQWKIPWHGLNGSMCVLFQIQFSILTQNIALDWHVISLFKNIVIWSKLACDNRTKRLFFNTRSCHKYSPVPLSTSYFTTFYSVTTFNKHVASYLKHDLFSIMGYHCLYCVFLWKRKRVHVQWGVFLL